MENTKQIHNHGSKYEIPDHVFTSLITSKCPASKYVNTVLKENAPTPEFHFNRDLACTNYILDYMVNGKLHLPKDVCPSKFQEELAYWGLEDSDIQPCCYTKYVSFFEDMKILRVLEKQVEKSRNIRETVDFICEGDGWKSWQAKLWRLTEYQNSSIQAKIFAYVSNAFVLLSLFILVAGTHKLFQRKLNNDEWLDFFDPDEEEHYFGGNRGNNPSHQGGNTSQPGNQTQNSTNASYIYYVDYPDNTYVTLDALQYLKWITVVYFSIELVMRIVCFPLTWKQFITFFNVVDVLALVVMYLLLVVQKIDAKQKYEENSLHDVIEEVQVIRVFRLFRLVKNISGFRVIMLTIRSSLADLMMLFLCLITAVLLFSSLVYFSRDPVFKSIPEASWWAIITLTTVGYGDLSPTTVQGKIIAALCAVIGVCMLAILIPVLVNNFLLINSHAVALERREMEKKKKITIQRVASFGSDKNRISSFPDKT